MDDRDSEQQVPLRWRTGPPAGRGESLYQFVREYLWRENGSCHRDELLAEMKRHRRVRERLESSRGFASLLSNMRHSGQIELDGDLVRATPRTLRRVASVRPTQASRG